MPIDGLLEPAYQSLLSRKLFVTPANFARVVELPSRASVGETALAIYSRKDNAGEAVITSTKAERNLWYAEFGEDPSFPKKPTVKIARCDAPFPESIAVAVSAGIKRMLAQSRPPTKSNLIILHGTDIEFSLEDSRLGTVRGLLTPYAQGKNGAALRRLTALLKKYCLAKLEKRAGLAEKIEAEAKEM